MALNTVIKVTVFDKDYYAVVKKDFKCDCFYAVLPGIIDNFDYPAGRNLEELTANLKKKLEELICQQNQNPNKSYYLTKPQDEEIKKIIIGVN
jgi:hypothetical protein